MNEKNNPSEFLEIAQIEENSHNWAEAIRSYEEAGKLYLIKKNVNEAANAYKRLGHVYYLASETADTKADFVESLKGAIESYNKSKDLFKQIRNKAEEIECEAEALFAKGFIASSVSEAKKSFNNSCDLFVETSNLFSAKNDDQESVARTLSRAAFSFVFLQPFAKNKQEVDQFFQKGLSISSKAVEFSLNLGNLRIFSERDRKSVV